MSGKSKRRVAKHQNQSGDEALRLDKLVVDPHNPRRIESGAAAGLSASMEEFGDLSGIVFNDRTGQLVAGHQRVDDLRKAGAAEFQRQGECGYIAHPKTGERFPIRFVDWDAVKQRKANLAANNPHIAGEFTDEALEQLQALQDQPDFEALRFDGLQSQLSDLHAGEIPSGAFDTFCGKIAGESATFSVTLNVDKEHEDLFENIPKPEAIVVLVEWLRSRRAE